MATRYQMSPLLGVVLKDDICYSIANRTHTKQEKRINNALFLLQVIQQNQSGNHSYSFILTNRQPARAKGQRVFGYRHPGVGKAFFVG